MFVYTTTNSYPMYSSPTLYPLSHHYVVPPAVPTSRELYLRAVAEAQAARARYISELEEQHILASLQQQEAFRQAEFCQRQIFSAQNDITRRRVGHINAENLCRPVASQQARRQVFVRRQKGHSFPTQGSQIPLNNLDALFSALLQDEVDKEYTPRQQHERIRAEQARKAAAFDAKIRLAKKLEDAFEATQADLSTLASQPLGPSDKVPSTSTTLDPSRIPFSRQTGILRNRLVHERAARTIQRRWRSHSADAAARNDAVTTIATLRARFQFLKDTFSFPEHLEFREVMADQEQKTPTLLFTPANAAVHAYIHELTKLLTLADAVSSHGSHRVREERRSFVRMVEEALDSVDRRVEKVWGKKVEGSPITRSGKGALELSTAVHANTPESASESVVHSPESNVSTRGVDPTTEPLASCFESNASNASTVTPSRVTRDINPPTLTELPLQQMISQDVPSEQGVLNRLPTPEKALNIQDDTTTTDSVREGHDTAVQVQLESVDTEEVTPKDLNSADTSSPSPPLLQSRPTEASRVSTVAEGEVIGIRDIVTSEGINVTSDSPASDLTTPDSFDVVYPDSPSASSIAQGDVDPDESTQEPSVSAEECVTPELRGTGNEAHNNRERGVEEEAFELL